MPVYGAGVAVWQECAAVKSGMLHGGGGVRCPLVLAAGGLCGSGAVGVDVRGGVIGVCGV